MYSEQANFENAHHPLEDQLAIMKTRVHRLDPAIRPGKIAFKVAVVVLAAAFISTGTEELVAFTAYPRNFIKRISQRMRASGLWADDGVISDWLDQNGRWYPERFWLHVLIAEGAVLACVDLERGAYWVQKKRWSDRPN